MGYTPDDIFMTIPREIRTTPDINGIDVKLDACDNIPRTVPGEWYPLHLWLKHLYRQGWLFINAFPLGVNSTAFIFRHQSTMKVRRKKSAE